MEKLIADLDSLSTAQITELRTRLESLWGVKAEVAVFAPHNALVEEKLVEPTSFGVHLTGVTNKMGVIKMLRELTGLGLLQAKEFVERALPQEVKTDLTKDQAEEMKRQLDTAGGSAEVKPV
jgi:large subunit ribosomal protein L7/L12